MSLCFKAEPSFVFDDIANVFIAGGIDVSFAQVGAGFQFFRIAAF